MDKTPCTTLETYTIAKLSARQLENSYFAVPPLQLMSVVITIGLAS